MFAGNWTKHFRPAATFPASGGKVASEVIFYFQWWYWWLLHLVHLVAAPCKIQTEWSLFHFACRYYAVPKQGWKPAVNPETRLVTVPQMTSHNTPPSEVLTLIPLTIFCSATSSLITSSTLCSWNPTYCPSLSLISRARLQFLSTPVPESIQPIQNNPLQVHPLPRQLSLPYISPNGIQFRDRLPGLRLATVWTSKCQIGFLQFIILLFSLLWTTLSMKEV